MASREELLRQEEAAWAEFVAEVGRVRSIAAAMTAWSRVGPSTISCSTTGSGRVWRR